MKLLHSYQNGENFVKIYDDGTKIRECYGKNDFPDHADVKITNYCDAGCPFCHEKSTKRGKHGDVDLVLKMWENLPAGCEIAVGGGSTLSHPKLIYFLETIKARGHIANVTVNQLHIHSQKDIIEELIDRDLVKGIGLSIRDVDEICAGFYFEKYPHLIYHLISGVHTFADFWKIREKFDPKFLILGYKEFGFGAKKAASVEVNKKTWIKNMPRLLTCGSLVSFDNLAIRQLNLRDYFSAEDWESLYMGDDGEFSLYVDAVEKRFGLNSCATERFDISDNVENSFLSLRKVA